MITVVNLIDCDHCVYLDNKKSTAECYCWYFICYMYNNCNVSYSTGYEVHIKDITKEELESHIILFSIKYGIRFNQVITRIHTMEVQE